MKACRVERREKRRPRLELQAPAPGFFLAKFQEAEARKYAKKFQYAYAMKEQEKRG